MMIKYFFLFILIVPAVCQTQAQGCSDAGFCSLRYTAKDNTKNSITVGNASGVTDGNTFVNGTYISYTRQLSKQLSWDTKLTANYASGMLANNFNVGDVFTTVSYEAWQHREKQNSLVVLGGLKIPLTAGNDKAGGKPLPMAYQASLGTFDVLLGAQFKLNKWEFTNAWQLPLSRFNKNTFISEYSVSNDFVSTNKLSRRADALLRVAYHLQKNKARLSFTPNVLAIYHLGEDSYEDIYAKRQPIKGSEGLTLNANLITKYRLHKNNSLELSLAAPFVARDIRPDGLTRKFTAEVAYKFSF